jgi:hypothetical protein
MNIDEQDAEVNHDKDKVYIIKGRRSSVDNICGGMKVGIGTLDLVYILYANLVRYDTALGHGHGSCCVFRIYVYCIKEKAI